MERVRLTIVAQLTVRSNGDAFDLALESIQKYFVTVQSLPGTYFAFRRWLVLANSSEGRILRANDP